MLSLASQTHIIHLYYKGLFFFSSFFLYAEFSFCPWLPNSRKTIFCQHINIVLENWYAGFWRLSRNRLTINATTHTLPERSFRDLSGNIWVVALIVYRLRDKS